MKKAMLIVTLAAGLAGGSNGLADILTPTAPPLITVPPGWSLLSLPPIDFNNNGLSANESDQVLFFENNTYVSSHTLFQSYGWFYPLPFLKNREAFAFFRVGGGSLAINNPYEAPAAPWNSSAAWKNDAASVSPTGSQYLHLLGYNGLEGGTFERIIDHIPHFHEYAIITRIDNFAAKHQTNTFANGRWFPEAPVLNAGEGAFFEFGPGNGPAVSSQISGVTRSLIPIDANAHAVEVVLTGRFLPNSTVQLRKSYEPFMNQLLSPTSLQVSDDKRVLQAVFDFSSAQDGDYDVLLNYPDGFSPRLMQNGVRLINSASPFYHRVEGSTILHNNNQPFNYDVIFQNNTGNTKTIDIRFYARQVNQSNPNVFIGNLQTFVKPASVVPAVTPGSGGSAWAYKGVVVGMGASTLNVPLIVDSAAVAPYQSAGKLPLHYALEVSWRESNTSWSDPVWMTSFIVP